jgi:hypothetical protein
MGWNLCWSIIAASEDQHKINTSWGDGILEEASEHIRTRRESHRGA